ncbi:TIGR01777 family oxidoreductase [Verrucomicrobiaceae bacterium 227]
MVGASGWLGKHLAPALMDRGWKVVGFSRSHRENDGIEWRQWNGQGAIDLSGCDALINLAGEPIDQRWTVARKKEFYESRVTLSEALSQATRGTKVRVFLNGSAIGFYGDRGDDLLPESASAGEGYLADLCLQWETAVDTLSDVRVCYLRTGVVLGQGGRAWEKLERVFGLGIGGRLGSGRQWMPWIHLVDEIGGIIHCLENEIAGPVNLVAPGGVRNLDFTKALGAALKRPTIFPAPAFMLKLILGEFAEEGLLASCRVVPGVLEKSGYQFKYPELKEALAELVS